MMPWRRRPGTQVWTRTDSPARGGGAPGPDAPASPRGDSGRRAPWPHRLEQRQDLRLFRGEVILMAGTPHVIVGYNGTHEVYLCWAGNADGGYDTSRLISVRRSLAHTSQKDLHADSTAIPPLPDIDHIGRPATCGGRAGRPPAEAASATPAAAEGAGRRRARFSQRATPDEVKPDEVQPGSALLPRPTSWRSFSQRATPETPRSKTGTGGAATPQPEELARQCTLASALKMLVFGLGTAARAAGRAVCEWWSSRAADTMQSGQAWVQRRDGTYYRAVKGDPARVSLPRAAALPCARPESVTPPAHDDFQIHIPIVKPPGWQEVQPLVHQMPVTFDERGIKESLTVKSHRWSHFVDRQRARLQREIEEMKRSGGGGDGPEEDDGDDPLSAGEDGALPCFTKGGLGRRQDFRELEHMVERMEDWKDLSCYSGKSISMASTQRGNEMKIHVLAFAEREDGFGVDFMWLDYRKSAEVRTEGQRAPGGMLQAARAVLPFLREPRGAAAEERERQWVDLLRRPDVAKFAIALAFKTALSSDGVHLEFCDGAPAEAGSGRRRAPELRQEPQA